MMVGAAELTRELKMLRKEHGLFASRIGECIGAALRDVYGVVEDDEPAVIQQKATKMPESLACDLPTDLRVAVLPAFPIWPDARMPLRQGRVSWGGEPAGPRPQKARRRIDDLAQLASADSIAGRQSCTTPPSPNRLAQHQSARDAGTRPAPPADARATPARIGPGQLDQARPSRPLATSAEPRELEAHVCHSRTWSIVEWSPARDTPLGCSYHDRSPEVRNTSSRSLSNCRRRR